MISPAGLALFGRACCIPTRQRCLTNLQTWVPSRIGPGDWQLVSLARTGITRTTLTTALNCALAVVLVAAILLCSPTIHVLLGLDVADAFDQGIMLPKRTSHARYIAPATGLLMLAVAVSVLAEKRISVYGLAVRSAVRKRSGITRHIPQYRLRISRADEGADGCSSIHTASLIRTPGTSAYATCRGFFVVWKATA